MQALRVDEVAEVVMQGVDGEYIGLAHFVMDRFSLSEHRYTVVWCGAFLSQGALLPLPVPSPPATDGPLYSIKLQRITPVRDKRFCKREI